MYDHALFGGWQTRLRNSPAATNADAKLFKRLLAKPRGCLCRRTSRADPQVQVAVRRGLFPEAHHGAVCRREIRAFDLAAVYSQVWSGEASDQANEESQQNL